MTHMVAYCLSIIALTIIALKIVANHANYK